MFYDDKGQVFEFIDQSYTSIYVHQIVVRELFAVYLGEHFVEISVKACALVRIFSVTQWGDFSSTEVSAVLVSCKISMDGRVIM